MAPAYSLPWWPQGYKFALKKNVRFTFPKALLTWVAYTETFVAGGVVEGPVQVDFVTGAGDAERAGVVPTKCDQKRTLPWRTWIKKQINKWVPHLPKNTKHFSSVFSTIRILYCSNSFSKVAFHFHNIQNGTQLLWNSPAVHGYSEFRVVRHFHENGLTVPTLVPSSACVVVWFSFHS